MFKNLYKIYIILGKKNLYYILTLIPVGILSIIIEFFSIATFVPLMQQLFGHIGSSPNNIITKFSEIIIIYFNNINLLLVFILCVIITKDLFTIFQNFYFLSVTKKIYLYICDRLFESKISEKYLNFKKKSSSFFLKDLRETSIVFRLYIECLINFFIEISVFIVILTLLLLVNLKLTIVIFLLFGVSIYLFTFLSKNFVANLGIQQNTSAEKINNILLNSYHNFIDIKLYGKSNLFKKIYNEANSYLAEIQKKMYFFYALPKSILELFAALILIVCLLAFKDIIINDNLGIFGIYLVSFYRLLPSVNKLLNLKMQLNSHAFSIDIIFNANKKNNNKINFIKVKSRIDFKNVYFSYDKKNIIIKDLNLTFKKGHITCLYGPSGCGKTTVVKLITGLINPNLGGKILIDNNKNYKNSYLNISYVSQSYYIMKDTLARNIIFNDSDKLVDFKKLNKILEVLMLTEVFRKKKINLNTVLSENASTLSGGQRQRIAIARALYKNSDIIILDESTNSLDANAEKKLIKNLHLIKKNKIIIIISHKKEIRAFSDVSYDLS
jgi:ABC-type bacteriocin/lantibiotic exporter with double-glycine peptidase domain